MISTRTDPSKSDLPRKRILIVGASGFIGSALSSFLSSAGHSVTKLVRRPATLENERSWDPDTGQLSPTVFDKIDIVINLAGENIAEGRWNAEKKRRLYDSRSAFCRDTTKRAFKGNQVLARTKFYEFAG